MFVELENITKLSQLMALFDINIATRPREAFVKIL